MFSGTAFPRIPTFGGAEEETQKPPSKPPAIPFDSLLLASEVSGSDIELSAETNAAKHRHNQTVKNYADVVQTIKTEDAKEFLTALAFLATRDQLHRQ